MWIVYIYPVEFVAEYEKQRFLFEKGIISANIRRVNCYEEYPVFGECQVFAFKKIERMNYDFHQFTEQNFVKNC